MAQKGEKDGDPPTKPSSKGGGGEQGGQAGGEKKTNSKGESHCFNCGKEGHWASDCPDLAEEQKEQLHMMEQLNMEDGENYEDAQKHDQFDALALAQLTNQEDKIYLDSCTTSSTTGRSCGATATGASSSWVN